MRRPLARLVAATVLALAAASPADAVELCAALDGSGSLSPAQFSLQLEGLAGAIEDPTIIPRDGSVTLSAVVFEWGATVEIPATVVADEPGAAALAAEVRAIPWRFGHRTDMVAAIRACMGQFRDPGETWVIDVSTDGRHSQTLGTDPLAARDEAVSGGLDVLNALGVGDADRTFLESLVWPQPASAPPADGFVVMIPDFRAFVAAMREKIRAEVAREVPLDIKPGSCPNPFRIGSRGRMPVALLGTADFDVAGVDPATLRLEGVAPTRWSYRDVGTPGPPRPDSCASCSTAGPDGFTDLVLHFDERALAAAVGRVRNRACALFTIRGNLRAARGGGPIRGADTVRIIRK